MPFSAGIGVVMCGAVLCCAVRGGGGAAVKSGVTVGVAGAGAASSDASDAIDSTVGGTAVQDTVAGLAY